MKRSLLLVAALLLPSCGGGSPTSSSATQSPANATAPLPPAARRSARSTSCASTLQQDYYWYKQLPDPDPAGFASPEAYLEAVRYRPLDTTYSYIIAKATSDAFYSDSQYIGFGLSYQQTGSQELRVTAAYPGSPVADVGLDRGHYLVSIGGRTVADLITTGDIATIFGPDQIGYTTDIAWRSGSGPVQSATVAKRLVTIPTVSQTATYDVGSSRVGYIHFRQLRAALRRRALEGLPAAQGPGRHRPGARPALQRRRAGLGRAAPGRPDRQGRRSWAASSCS